MEEHGAEGCLDAREYDPWAHTGRVTAEFRKREVTMRGERTWDGAMLTEGPMMHKAAGLTSGPKPAPSCSMMGLEIRGTWSPARQQEVHGPLGEARPWICLLLLSDTLPPSLQCVARSRTQNTN